MTRFLFLLSLASGGAAHAAPPSVRCEVSVYAYDSFLSAKGLGPILFEKFEKKTGCHVKALAVGDGGQLVTRLQLDHKRNAAPADVVIGLDPWSFRRAQALLETTPPLTFSDWAPELKALHWPAGFVPFDYGVFAFMVDSAKLAPKDWPKKLVDLLDLPFRRQIILEDPRTSTPGLGFLLHAKLSLGEKAANFWGAMRTQWLTLAPGWDGAYALFLKGEAPLVWSYLTSEAYHREHDPSSTRFRALIFDDGQPVQIEGAALTAGISTVGRANAVLLLEMLLSAEVQAELARRQWMMPARSGVALPSSFAALPKPKRSIELPALNTQELSDALKEWSTWILRPL